MCINEYIICLALCLLIFLSVCAICCCCVFLKYRTGNYIACCLSESKICVIGQLHLLYKCKFIVRMFVWIISEKEYIKKGKRSCNRKRRIVRVFSSIKINWQCLSVFSLAVLFVVSVLAFKWVHYAINRKLSTLYRDISFSLILTVYVH